jgi:hypothetical protein
MMSVGRIGQMDTAVCRPSIGAWQVHVYEDKPRTQHVGGVHPGGPGGDPRHRVPLPCEPPRQVEGHNHFIFDDQYLG